VLVVGLNWSVLSLLMLGSLGQTWTLLLNLGYRLEVELGLRAQRGLMGLKTFVS